LSAKEDTARPWDDHKKLIKTAKRIIENKNASIIFTTHPRTGSVGVPSLDGVAGGKAVTRFSDATMWLALRKDDHEGPVRVCAWEPGDRVEHCAFNRSLHFLKTRDGGGEGMALAISFSRDEFCFNEKGIAKPEKKRKGGA
jgi:hypothetical protein